MIAPPAGARILLATKPVDFRKGAHSLAALAAEVLGADPFSGAVLVFRSRRADRIKILIWDGSGLVHQCSQNLCGAEGVRGRGGRRCSGACGVGALDGEAPRWRRARARSCRPGGACRRRNAAGWRC